VAVRVWRNGDQLDMGVIVSGFIAEYLRA